MSKVGAGWSNETGDFFFYFLKIRCKIRLAFKMNPHFFSAGGSFCLNHALLYLMVWRLAEYDMNFLGDIN